jgi:hypothetical protein
MSCHLYSEWKPKVIFSHAINCLLAPPCGHLSLLVHNTVWRKPIIAHLMVHVNSRNITLGTGSYTLPVDIWPAGTSDNVAKKLTPWENPTLSSQLILFVIRYHWYRYFNPHENLRTKRSPFAPLRGWHKPGILESIKLTNWAFWQ